MKQAYALASQFWGEGPGAQELTLHDDWFEAPGHAYASGFFAVDVMAEAANFPNLQDEVAGSGVAVPPINQDILIADNTFTTDRPQALVNLSSVDNVVLSDNRFRLEGEGSGPRQYPVTVHDAGNLVFEATTSWASEASGASCTDSIMERLSDPAPLITAFAPIACTVPGTTSGLVYRSK